MRKFECDEAEVKEAIDRVVRRTMNMDLTWNWSCGVAYYGICRAWEVTGKQEYIDFLVDWRAYKGILTNIDEDGSVRNVSAGTAVMYSADDYKVISKKRVQGWGQGLTLAYLVALLQNKEVSSPI